LEYVEKEDITVHQAIAMTKDILFNNSNVLYDLRYQPDFEDIRPKSITYTTGDNGTKLGPTASPSLSPLPKEPVSRSQPITHSPLPTGVQTPSKGYEPPLFPPLPQQPQVYDVQIFEEFMAHNPGIKFVYVQWLDYMATIRARMVPINEFERLIRTSGRIGISQGNTGTLQNDGITPVVNPVGQIYVEPDLRSLRKTHKKDPLPAATVLCFWRDESGRPIRECPRANLETLINDLQYNHGINLLCGFEIEVTFLSRNSADKEQPYAPVTQTHAWGTLTPEQWLRLPLLAEIATSLSDMGIDVQQFHAESGQGQYEFVLAPQPLMAAVDSLIQARQVIAQIAALHDLRATLHPQPFPGIGTAAHVHISLNPPDKDTQFFVGGVLRHLPAICAFTMPSPASYSRVTDDHWTGGTWVAWGTQNRETPLRRVTDGRWEVRCLDGLANMYFALSSILAAGLLGLKANITDFSQKDVPCNPSQLDEEGRAAYGVVQKLPASFDEAMEALRADGELNEALAQGLIHDYMLMKGSEQKMLASMGEAERRIWLIERY
jgi:glutamine synthetase